MPRRPPYLAALTAVLAALTAVLAALTAVLAPATAVAQEPRFTVLVPENGSLLMRAKLGETSKRLIIITRLSKNVRALKVDLPDAPFFLKDLTDDRIDFGDRDTVEVEVTFEPTLRGRFQDTVHFTDGSHRAKVVLYGEADPPDQRWSLLLDKIDFGILEPDQTEEARFGLQNNSNDPITLKWNRPLAAFTTHRPNNAPLEPVTEVRLNPGETVFMLTIAHGDRALPGPNIDTLEISDGKPYDQRGNIVQRLVLMAYLGDTSGTRPGRLVFIPSVMEFPSQPASGTTTTQRAKLMYAGKGFARVGQFNVVGMSSRNFTFTTSPLPKDLYPGDSVVVNVTYDHQAEPFARAVLNVRGVIFDGSQRVDGAGMILFSGDTTRTRQVDIELTANDANIGGTSTATFTNRTNLPQDFAYGVISLRYNASVLAPLTETIDAEDPVEEGLRTSRFRINIASLEEGGELGSVPFRVALGNAASTPLDVVGVQWFNADNLALNVNTTINSTTVTVLDAVGNEVNVDVGPLSLAVNPTPVVDNATVTYARGEFPATLKLYDQMGSMVMDLTSQLQGASGSFTISGSTLPPAVYLLHLSGGRYSYVIRMLVE